VYPAVEKRSRWQQGEIAMPQHVFNSNLLKRTDEVGLLPRTVACLTMEHILYIGDLVQMTESELLRTQHIGGTALHDIKSVLAGMKLHLGMDVPGWPPETIGR
jgi:DNA-directed RNA polymerase subunit alpha